MAGSEIFFPAFVSALWGGGPRAPGATPSPEYIRERLIHSVITFTLIFCLTGEGTKENKAERISLNSNISSVHAARWLGANHPDGHDSGSMIQQFSVFTAHWVFFNIVI